MHKILNLYFPAIRSLENIASELQEDESLKRTFNAWSPEKRMHFIDICTGKKGVRMLYEPFLPEMIRSSFVRDALEGYLGTLTGLEVTIEELLMDSPHDMILLECFVTLRRTGEMRCIRFLKENSLSQPWKNISGEENVYTTILLDNSPEKLNLSREEYMYYGCGQNGSRAEKEKLGEYCVFCLDRFTEHIRRDGIKNMMDAWWTFFVCEEPELLVPLIIKYQFFKSLYEELYHILADTGRTIRLMQGNMPHTDCGKKCAWLIRAEQELAEQKKQNAGQDERIRKLQGVIDKQAYIISEQCREESEAIRRKRTAENSHRKKRHGNNRKKCEKGKKTGS